MKLICENYIIFQLTVANDQHFLSFNKYLLYRKKAWNLKKVFIRYLSLIFILRMFYSNPNHEHADIMTFHDVRMKIDVKYWKGNFQKNITNENYSWIQKDLQAQIHLTERNDRFSRRSIIFILFLSISDNINFTQA